MVTQNWVEFYAFLSFEDTVMEVVYGSGENWRCYTCSLVELNSQR